MKTFSAFIKRGDLFGYKYRINFNGKGNPHRTLLGGSATIIIYALMLWLIKINFERVLFNLDDKNTTEHGLIDQNDTTPVNYNETNMFNFFVIRK